MPERLDPETTKRKLNARQKREKAVKLRTLGKTWQQIADEVGYSGPAASHAAVQEYFRNYPSPDADELRRVENLKLDDLEQQVREVLVREHVIIQHGKVVGRFAGYATDPLNGGILTDKDGKPIATFDEIPDDAPILQAVAQLLRIYERRAKLNGIDRPIVIRIEDEDALDEEIEALSDQINQNQITIPPGHPG